MENSILKSTKKILGLDPEYDVFDLDVITHINSSFSTLTQLGIGPTQGFRIVDDVAVWEDFLGDETAIESVKTYVFLKVRLVFDPPPTSFVIAALEKQVSEIEWRLSTHREDSAWTDPNPPSVVIGDE